MPTIDQLAPATASSDTDELMASQSGIARKVTRAQMVAGLQPAISIPSGTILGRESAGIGAAETLTIGANLVLNSGTLSATTGYVVSTLSAGTVPAVGDLVAMGQNGANTAVPYAQFMSGLAGVSGVDASQLLVTATGASKSQKLADFAANTVQTTGGQMSGYLTLAGNPTAPLQAATMQYVQAEFALALPKAGGTMTGALTLAADPTAPLQSATKEYVDTQVSKALPITGGTMTGLLALATDPVASSQAATKHYVDNQVATAVPVAGGTMTGPLTLAADPTASLQAATKHYVDSTGASSVPLTGGTLTGPLTLAADPTAPLQAATKHYVDTSATSGVPVTGATMTGPLLLSGNPSVALQATPKQYVDAQVATALPKAGGTLTGVLTLAADPTSALQAATKEYVDAQVSTALPTTGGSLTGGLTLAADPTLALQAATKEYVDAQVSTALPKSGGTLTGALSLAADPTAALQAATKEYVDAQVATALPKSGGTLTGQLSTLATGSSVATGNNVGTFDCFASQFSFRRQVTSGDPGQPTVYVGLTNLSSGYPHYYSDGEYVDVPAMIIQAQNVAGTTGQLNGLKIILNSGGNNPFDSEDQGLNVQVVKAGQNSTWAINTQSLDTTGLPPQSFATVGAELDLGGSGYDNPAGAYDPYQSNRATMWFNGRPYPWPNWAASTAYGVGAIVVGTPTGGVASTYIAQNAGTSGATAPSWPTSGTVVDNGITWSYGTTYAFSIGRGIWFDSNLGPSEFQWGTCISGDAIVQNAFLDTQRVTFASSGGAAIRLSANQIIDFSGNLTAAGQNQHTLQYSAYDTGLAYNIGSTGVVTALLIKDSFQVSIAGVTSIANTTKGNLSGVTTGYSPSGLTIGWNYAAIGETDLMVDANGLNIYPVSATGTTPALPIFTLSGAGNLKAFGSVAAGTTLSVAGVAALAVTVSGSLHGVTSGYSPQGLTVGWSYANVGETDLMVSADGMNIYTVSSGGVSAASPIFALSGTGNVTLSGLKASTSYANDAAAATGGVAVGQVYRNGSVVQIRIS
jgi:hypothetical protein